jgi:hypothetical protein
MSLKPTIQLIAWLAIWVALVLLSSPLMAEEKLQQRISKTISFTQSDNLDKTTKDARLKQADADVMESLNKEGFRMESTVRASYAATGGYTDIIVYDASTDLISDLNYDGFYHRFSVVIDVDTVYETSYVYAQLYLSLEGGPWNHYATSSSYHIYGDSENDTFVIETELAEGFPPGYYDVKIEIYDADTGQWLVNYGPYEDSSLSGLPLEDSYYDDSYDSGYYPIETNVVVAGHAGSLNWLLLLPFMIIAGRRLAIR